jgi:Icc-related predicted phosphoesterase
MSDEGSDPLGCEELAIRLAAVKSRLHVFGHIHDGYGFQQVEDITYVNASVCDEDYKPVNPVMVVDLDRKGRVQVEASSPGPRRLKREQRGTSR